MQRFLARLHLTNALVAVLVSFALVMTAFAHRPAVAGPVPDLSAYVLPNGSLPDLCIPGDGGDSGKGAAPCEFCRLASTVMMPAPPCEPGGILRVVIGRLGDIAVSAETATAVFPAAPLRGPPPSLRAPS